MLKAILKENDSLGVALKECQIAWIQKVPNNDKLSLIVTKIIDSPNSFPQNVSININRTRPIDWARVN